MAEIHIFSGLGTALLPFLQQPTQELEQLIDELPNGVDAQHHTYRKVKSVRKAIVNKRDEGTLEGPICLIGHSQGVKACAQVADHLDDAGIDVDYVAAIDPTLDDFPEFDTNVAKVEEFWAIRGFVAEFRERSNETAGVCAFVNGWSGNHVLDREVDANHIQCVSDATVRAKILASIEELTAN